MICDRVRSCMLDKDLGRAEREELRELLAHIEGCSACQSAIDDYDHLRETLHVADDEIQPTGGWDSFADRLAGSAAVQPHRRRAFWPAALAACIGAVVVGWTLHARLEPTVSPRQLDRSAITRLVMSPPTEQEIVDRAHLFNQVSDVFDGRAEWILLADHASDMGVGTAATDPRKSLLLIRLSISHDGALFSTADLIVVPGQVARTTVPAAGNLELKYEVVTSLNDPGHIRISAELCKVNHDAQRIGLIGSDLSMRMGQVVSIGQVVTGTGTYEFNVGLYRTSTAGPRS